MKYSLFDASKAPEVINLFGDVFSASEGEEEGRIIADFVSKLIATTQQEDLIGCIAEDGDGIVASLFFSRFGLADHQVAYILSPMAVSTDVQGRGIGQKLIRYGLDYLLSLKVDLVFTYGDPLYYSKTGFKQIDESIVRAPCPLSQPVGWLAQSLDGMAVQPIDGPTKCVDALNDPGLW